MITIGFSSHHVEALPYMREQMERHQVIVLEEPPSPHFSAMLCGDISIDDYILELDSGFPKFARQLCDLLRKFFKEGREIVQVEPYLERLLRIHELLAEGKTAKDVVVLPELNEVYALEKRATSALISHYSRSVNAPFEAVVEGVKEFARADAVRLIVREKLRAKVIASISTPTENMYVEAGYIHYPLYKYLRNEIGKREHIRVAYLLAPVIKRFKGKRRNMGPGDILTLRYALHNALNEEMADLLAARSLIYIKLIQKEELLPGDCDAPHTEDMVKVNKLVDSLDFHQCRELFQQIRMAKREEAVELTQEYVLKIDKP